MKTQTLKRIAWDVAKESNCVSMQAGAVLSKDGHIISTGYNGTPKGATNCCDLFSERSVEHSEWSEKYEVHAEMNAILYCPVSTQGSDMVITHSPCWNCTKHIVAAGVKSILFDERYYRMTDEEYETAKNYCEELSVEFRQM